MSRTQVLLLGATAVVVGAGVGIAVGQSALGQPPGSLGLPLGLVAAGAIAFALVARRAQRVDDVAGLRLFRRELARARRFQEPLTLLRIRPAEPRAGSEVARGQRVGQAVRRLLRLTDISWHDDESVYVAMPNTSRASAGLWLSRVERAAALRPAELTIAVFPEDALTETGLMGRLADVPPVRPLEGPAWADASLDRLDGDPASQPRAGAG